MMPRFSPPTAMGLPRKRASAACSTEAKKGSASRCTMERGKETEKCRFLHFDLRRPGNQIQRRGRREPRRNAEGDATCQRWGGKNSQKLYHFFTGIKSFGAKKIFLAVTSRYQPRPALLSFAEFPRFFTEC